MTPKTVRDPDLDCCMCGQPLNNHEVMGGHTPVSMNDYYEYYAKQKTYREIQADMAERWHDEEKK